MNLTIGDKTYSVRDVKIEWPKLLIALDPEPSMIEVTLNMQPVYDTPNRPGACEGSANDLA